MNPQYGLFLLSLDQASATVAMMFGIVLLAVAAWFSIPALPVKWQARAYNGAKVYTVIVLISVLYYSWRLK